MLNFLVYNGTNYIAVIYNLRTNAQLSASTIFPKPNANATVVGYAIYESSRHIINWQTYNNMSEIRVYTHPSTLEKARCFPLGIPSTSPKVKDISIKTASSSGNPIYTAHNPSLSSDSIRVYQTTDTISPTDSLGVFRYLPLSVYDTTTPARYLYQIIEDTSNGKLYFLYGAQSSYWTDDSILLIERRGSYDNPTVEATSPVYGNTYGWRSDAPLAGGFLKGTKIYCPQRNQSGSTVRFHSIDLSSSSFTLSTTPEFTVTLPSDAPSGNAFNCWGNGTTFWLQKRNNAYAFKVSDYSRDAVKDVIGLRGTWGTSRQVTSLSGDSEHLIACQPTGSFVRLSYYRKEDGVYVKDEILFPPAYRYSVFFNQYVPSTLTNTEPNSRVFAYYSNGRATAVYGGVYARTS